jgi:hypothetical protein
VPGAVTLSTACRVTFEADMGSGYDDLGADDVVDQFCRHVDRTSSKVVRSVAAWEEPLRPDRDGSHLTGWTGC